MPLAAAAVLVMAMLVSAAQVVVAQMVRMPQTRKQPAQMALPVRGIKAATPLTPELMVRAVAVAVMLVLVQTAQ